VCAGGARGACHTSLPRAGVVTRRWPVHGASVGAVYSSVGAVCACSLYFVIDVTYGIFTVLALTTEYDTRHIHNSQMKRSRRVFLVITRNNLEKYF
jgi:hypothetical protein